MTRLAIAILVSMLLTLYAEQASADGRRVALVVGIGAYQTVPQLPNAVNDATAMAEMFRTAGFDVVTARTDVGNLELKRAIRDFEDAAADSDIAVVFYAGHGIQIQRTNYLIPTDAKLLNERDADDEAISLDRIITALEPAKRLRLVILDACRDNPFGSKMKRRVASRAISAGLGRVETSQTDTLIAYAAAEGFVANDGEAAHSPFTTALLASLTVPGLDVRLAFGRVRDDVLKATGRRQEPYVYGSLGGGTVALVPAKAEAAPAALTDNAKSDYEIVERVGKKEAWEVFLNTHKTGLYAELARVQVAKLSTGGTYAAITPVASDASGGPPAGGMPANTRTSPRVEPPPVQPVPKPSAAEQRAWDRLRLSTDQGAIRKFIETYPSSLLLPEAEDRLDTLQRLAREREAAARLEREAARQRDEDDRQKKAAELERKRLDREAAKQREEAERAKAAEAARQKAETMAAAKQREAEERARAAEVAARKREDEEAARLAAIAVRRQEAEQRAEALAAERRKAEAEAAARQREADAATRAAEAAKAVREAEERSRAQAAGELTNRERATEAQAKAAAKAEAQAAAEARAAEERERTKAAEIAARQKEAEERGKAAEIARRKAESETVVTDREDAEHARIAEAARRKAKDEAQAERRRAQAAAEAAAERQAERAAAARRREAAESAREAADEAAAANRRRAAEATRRAADRQAERAAAVADQRRRAAQQAKEASRSRAAQVRAAPAPRARAEARVSAPAPRSSGGGGGGAAPMVGIGF
ncbi:caspase family protein [uncultured Methylobacterium sp.]|uniref:caspase family protein n=1 Tax=uncultured Methylobacterium sp. TaxID=157278 RepID=UPI0035C987F8